MKNMSIKEIKERIDIIQDQMQTLSGEVEELENLKNSIKTKKFKELVNGTAWTIDDRCQSLWYSGGSKRNKTGKDDALENYVFRELELYPHGSAFVTENIKVRCDDGLIELIVDITEKMHREASKTASYKVDSYGDIQYITLFKFAKDHDMSLSLEDLERKVKQEEESLQHTKEDLVHIIQLMDQ